MSASAACPSELSNAAFIAAASSKWPSNTQKYGDSPSPGQFDGDTTTQVARQARNLVGTILRLDLKDGRQAERIWYALDAIADLDLETLGIDCRPMLREGHDRNQEAYEAAYDAFCDVTGRTYARSRKRTMRVMSAYLEGIAVHRRYGRGADENEELIDAAIRIFWATTKPVDAPEHDVDGELFADLAAEIMMPGAQ